MYYLTTPQTDRQTEYHANSRSHCVAIRSATKSEGIFRDQHIMHTTWLHLILHPTIGLTGYIGLLDNGLSD